MGCGASWRIWRRASDVRLPSRVVRAVQRVWSCLRARPCSSDVVAPLSMPLVSSFPHPSVWAHEPRPHHAPGQCPPRLIPLALVPQATRSSAARSWASRWPTGGRSSATSRSSCSPGRGWASWVRGWREGEAVGLGRLLPRVGEGSQRADGSRTAFVRGWNVRCELVAHRSASWWGCKRNVLGQEVRDGACPYVSRTRLVLSYTQLP